MPDEILKFDEYRRRRDDDDDDHVPCARCGKLIFAGSTRCPECGVHFQGEAWEFSHPVERKRGRGRKRAWIVVVAILAIATILFARVIFG